MQEVPGDDVAEYYGRVPRTIEVELAGDLIDCCVPGDALQVTPRKELRFELSPSRGEMELKAVPPTGDCFYDCMHLQLPKHGRVIGQGQRLVATLRLILKH